MRAKEFESDMQNDWCAGCGDYGILRALEKAFAELQLKKEQVAVFGGIGCSGKTPYYLDVNGIHTLHGRLLPFATGAKLANPDLTVVAVGGDGDGLGIGAGHLVNAGRRNIDITYLVFNNEVYGLTKGQASPTIRPGEKTKVMATESIQGYINPTMLALTSGFTWVGRGYAYNIQQLSALIQSAISYKGSAFLEILQPCPVYNDLHDKLWFERSDSEGRPRLYSLKDENYDPYVPVDADDGQRTFKFLQCVEKSHEWGEHIPIGLFYCDLSAIELTQRIRKHHPCYPDIPPARQVLTDPNFMAHLDMPRLLSKFAI